MGLGFVAEKTTPQNPHPLDGCSKGEIANYPDTFAPIDILDYINAVLQSPTYQEKYKEFLKIDFLMVPLPSMGINPLEHYSMGYNPLEQSSMVYNLLEPL